MGWQLHHGDCLTILQTLPAESVNLIFADPPYNIGKAVWDKIPNYLNWCEKWIAACSRVLKRNGAFWVSHSEPRILTDLSRMIEQHGRGLVNWVTWDKYNGNPTKQAMGGPMVGLTMQGGLRSWQDMAEYLIYHGSDLHAETVCAVREKATRAELACLCGCDSRLVQFWEDGERLIQQSVYALLDANYGPLPPYSEIRRTFNNPGKVSSVWQFDPAPRNGHPTPKPEPLLERIILTCTNAGDTVLDPFAGSGTTLAAAEKLGRESIGVEMDAGYCELIRRRMVTVQPDLFAASGEPPKRRA